MLFLLAKLMGEKQISQLSIFDYMTGITIGSIAAEMATDLENPEQALTALIVYGLAAYLVSILTNKSLLLRKLLNGQSIILMDKGVIYRANLAAARLDVGDFLTLCRSQGYFDLTKIETAVMEHNGAVSILPKAAYKPFTPSDAGVKVMEERPKINVILDGKPLNENLKLAGRDMNWLSAQLTVPISDIMLAFVTDDGTLAAFPMNRTRKNTDWFE